MALFVSSNHRATRVRWHSAHTTYYYETPSPLDVSLAWFRDDDYKVFRRQAKILARLSQEIGADAMETYCNDTYRGLEFMINGETRETRNTRRELAWAIVLDHSSDQSADSRKGKHSGWERVVAMYKVVSKAALMDAQYSAQQDSQQGNAKSPCEELTFLDRQANSCPATPSTVVCLLH
ncbi:hypothetical protein IV203_029707 [Nitzschia inconspicua]|uniref:Uncharacterized protein n=1 Tax=Nitzschia inconspicua TaxID=303405 RepID=A0A9K3LRV6_9STRA|nr:hypothetical protein IV203_029707 [Nitzschia inconspicua]